MSKNMFSVICSAEQLTKCFIIAIFLASGFAQYMESPCPNVFRYQFDRKMRILYGDLEVSVPDNGFLELNVELSIGNVVSGSNGAIELATTSKQEVIDAIVNHRPVRYRVIFPVWRTIPPKVTKILANGRPICSGPKLTVNQVPVVTTINLQHRLSVDVQTSSVDGNPPSQNQPGFVYMPVGGGPYKVKSAPDTPPIIEEILPKDVPYRSFTEYGGSNNGPDYPIVNGNNRYRFKPILNNPFNFRPQIPKNISKVNNWQLWFESETPPKYPNSIEETSRPRLNIAPKDVYSKPNLDASSQDICGQSLHTNNLIVYGNSVSKGAYPWLAALFRVTNLGPNYTCSASLISNRHVITAAHCVFYGDKKIKPSQLIVTLGKLNLQKWTQSIDEKQIEPEYIHVHPDYRSLTSDADIAMLVLSETISFTNNIRPLCLWHGNNQLEDVVGIEGTVVGWGRDEDGNLMTAEAKQTKLPIVSQEQCLRSSEQYRFITSSRTFCAGFRNGSGPCNGDSGSGFIVQSEGRWVLRGVVSMSLATQTRSCDLKNYIVFTDASKFMTWINDLLK